MADIIKPADRRERGGGNRQNQRNQWNLQGSLPLGQAWMGNGGGKHLPPSGSSPYKKLPEATGSGAGPGTNADVRHPIIVKFM